MDGSKLKQPAEEDSWKLPPEAVDELRGPSQEDMHRAAARAWKRPVLAGSFVSRFISRQDNRFSGRDGWVLIWRPLGQTICGFGLALALIVGQFWMPALDKALGDPLGEYYDLVHLGVILLAGVCVIVAWPLYRPADWTPAKQDEEDRAHDYFSRKRGL